MVCQGLEAIGTSPTLVDFMSYPTLCDFQFYAKIMGALFIIIAVALYFSDRERLPKADFISAMGVSAIATISIALAGTVAGFIQQEIFLEVLVPCAIIIVIWMLKK